MSSAPHQQKYDKRLYKRYIARGELDRGDFDKHLDDLADMESEADSITHLVLGEPAAESAAAPEAEAAEPAPAAEA